MKKLLIFLLIIFTLFYKSLCCSAESVNTPDVFFFYSSHCEECFYLQDKVLPPIKKKYSGKISWREINIDTSPDNLELALSTVLKDKKMGTLSPSVVIGETVLMGAREIEESLEEAIQKEIKDVFHPTIEYKKTTIVDAFKKISLATIIASGLVDGINPCAFAVIAFLVAIMSVYGFRKRNVLIIGGFYSLAVFLTYLAIGMGLINFIYTITFYRISSFFHMVIGGLCFLFAGLSIYDLVLYKRTGSGENLVLTLPAPLKKRINAIIGSGLRGENKSGFFRLSIAAFIVGIMVSVLEMVCTGQIYLPTLVYIMKNSDYRLHAFLYILVYNFMFIIPLLAILCLFLLGAQPGNFNSFLKKHVGTLKIAMAIIFVALGIGILIIR
jgi:hypothetical protein